MFEITQKISEAFTRVGMKNKVEELVDRCQVRTIIVGTHAQYELLLVSVADNSAAAFRIYSFYPFSREQHTVALEAANACNLRYRYVRFVAHEDSISVEYDFPLNADNRLPAMAVEIALRFLNILEDAWPTIDRYFKKEASGLLN